MQVTCPSCKLVGTVRDEHIPEEGRELYCPNCNTKFRVKKNLPAQARPQETVRQGTFSPLRGRPETLRVSCPACGFKGKIRRDSLTPGQERIVACPACGKSFTVAPPADMRIPKVDAALPAWATGGPAICPACGAGIPRTVPVCTACGQRIRGVTIRCPSCKSANVSISEGSERNGRPRRETTLFVPFILPPDKLGGIKIPLLCRDCGRSWKMEPTIIPKTARPVGSSEK